MPVIHGLHYNPTHNALQSTDYIHNLRIIPIIRKSDHNPHEHELLALHQVRSFKVKTNKQC